MEKTGGKFEIGERVLIGKGEWGGRYKGTQSEKNMVRMGTKCCDEGEVGVIINWDWESYGWNSCYKRRKYQVNLGDDYGHLWFCASQMKKK